MAIDLLTDKAKEYWHRPWAGLLASIVSLFTTLLVVSDGATAMPTIAGWTILVVSAALPLGLWATTNRLNPVERGKVGIIVALASEDDKHDQQVRNDFIESLRKLLERDPDGANFQMVVLPRHLAGELEDFQAAMKYLQKLRGHFMLFGKVRKRHMKGGQVHVLTFNGVVRHAPIPQEQSKAIASEFRSVVPARVIIPIEGDFFAFEATSQLTDVSTRYIIGRAALASGDVGYAERLLLEVERLLQSGLGAHQPLREIGQKLPQYFAALYQAWLNYLINGYTATRNIEFIRQADEIVNKLLQREPRLTYPYLTAAICEFLLRRDIPAAKQAVMKARMVGDTTWRYSMGFLTAFEGNLDAADTWYRDAFKGKVKDVTVPVQCEEFIQGVLEGEPGKVQLHYCSGLINYYAKKDSAGALRDFKAFLEAVPKGAFEKQQAKARELIAAVQTDLAFVAEKR